MEKKEFWRRIFSTHDRMKLYYIQISILLLLVFPFRFLFDMDMWLEVASSKENLQSFINVMYLVMILFGLIVMIIYFTLWRFLFPKYIIVKNEDKYPAGRVYFYTQSPLAQWSIRKRAWAGLSVPEKEYIWVCRWMLNPFSPWNSLEKIWLPKGTHFVRDVTELRIWEEGHKYKIVSKDGVVEYVVDGGESVYHSDTIIERARGEAKLKLKEMIKSTQQASQASISHIQRALEHGSFDISWDLKADIERIKREREERFNGSNTE